ncbi:AraC family transcriptional regulator [Pedobacter endophyticus]|uniref:AraC family transcriptional regulator n=1 Tax=Pedobacter endophyticus TaxID=2789740 RepID=A0A7S9L0D3_9SPHI|nr:helix-turn-helix domain-containing protein [Pedobacter endophyticus]QPH40154.1 AraC family transcriptional regulator [Pedobacter endophyticus]
MYKQFDPPDDLKHLVCFFYMMEYSCLDEPLQPILPSGTEIMGWQYAGHWRVQYCNGYEPCDFLLPEFYTAGQQTSCYHLTATTKHTGIIGAALQPGTLWQIFKQPAEQYTQAIIETGELFAYNLLKPAITYFREANDVQTRLQRLIAFYRELNSTIQFEHSLVNQALEFIFDSKGCITMEKLCVRMGVNERYLQRHFKMRIGVTTQQYIQTIRFNNAFASLMLTQGCKKAETTAMLYNYYDISHFNKDFKRYFGEAPTTDLLTKFSLLGDLMLETPYPLQVQDRFSPM